MKRALTGCMLALAFGMRCAAEPAPMVPAEPSVCAAGPSAAWRAGGAAFVIQTGAHPASVRRHALTIAANGAVSIGAVPAWDAAALPAPEARNIFTHTGQVTVPFTWTLLPPELRALLNADGLGEARTAYLRGDRRRELGQGEGVFRRRVGVLGDIGHSVPLIVGAPAASSAQEGHDTFRQQAGGRVVAVYVGANDGMLHAFDSANGAELFAYVPQALIGALAQYGDPGFRDRAYVDGSAGQGDALLDGRWRTVLVSGMGMGARGVFALDITNPSAFAQGMGALWEFTERDDPAIGFISAPPQVAMVKTGSAHRYFAIVAGGINSREADGSGALYLLALDKPAAQPWQAGLNYYRIASAGADPALPNALAPAGLVTDADGSAILAYAGDLQGNLWRFDLVARTAQRVFTARDAAGRAQPIVHAPRVVFAPGGGYLVLFGTGKLIEQADFASSSFSPQSLYAILDRPHAPPDPIASRAQLAQRTLSGTDSYTVRGNPIEYFGPGSKRGWYLDFPNTRSDGERTAASPTLAGGTAIFHSVLPGAHPCAAAATRTYVLDALSGLVAGARRDLPTAELTSSATPRPPLLLDAGTVTGPRDATGGATATRTLVTLGTSGEAAGRTVAVRFRVGRLGWREVANWQELHDAANR